MTEHEEISNGSTLGTQKVTWFTILFSMWVGVGGWITSFDQNYTGIVLNMAHFKSAFGTCTMMRSPTTGALSETCLLTATQQSLNSAIYTIYIGVGALFSAITGS